MIKFALVGALGRMGQSIASISAKSNQLLMTLAIHSSEKEDYPSLTGLDFQAPIKTLENANLDDVDGVIDFSSPKAISPLIKALKKYPKPLVIGTTGLSENDLGELKKISENSPLVQANNMSLGVNLTFSLAKTASAALRNKSYDAELVEIHHKHKKDAPSGTSRTLESILLQEWGRDPKDIVRTREGIMHPRSESEIGSFSLRGGDVVGEHTLYFLGEGEKIEIRHTATSRSTFASGALKALEFVTQKQSGYFTMQDVLGLK